MPEVEITATMHVEDVEGMNWTTIHGICDGEEFLMTVGMQTDDRDMDIQMIAGPNMGPDSEGGNWDALLVAMSGRHGW